MELELILELEWQKVVVGQSMPIKLILKNNSKDSLEIPLLIDSGKVTNFALYDDKGELIDEYNGVTLAVMEGMRPNTTITLVELGSGESWVWDVDLHRYIKHLVPRAYGIQAIYRYEDEQLELTSEIKKIVVHPQHPVYLDVLRDQVMAGMIYTLVIHKADMSEEEKVLMNMGYDSKPDNFLYGGALELGEGACPLISKVDFINAMDFDHDTYRWLAWSQEKSIHAVSVFRGNIKSGPVEVAVDLEEATLIPRPIQHQDKGITLFVKGKRGKDDFVIVKIDLDAGANEVSRNTIAVLNEMPHPASVSATHTGDIHIVWGKNGCLPIKWFKMSEKTTEPSVTLVSFPKGKQINPVDVIFVEPFLPVGPISNHSVLMMLIRKKFNGINIRFLGSMMESEKHDICVGPGFFLEGEPEKITPIYGNIIQDRNLSLIGVFATRDGLVYYVSPRGDMKSLLELDPNLARFSSLLLSRGSSINLFYLEDEKGISTRTLVPGRRAFVGLI